MGYDGVDFVDGRVANLIQRKHTILVQVPVLAFETVKTHPPQIGKFRHSEGVPTSNILWNSISLDTQKFPIKI